MIEQFHFLRPVLLILIPPGLILISVLWKRHATNTNWNQICDPQLLEHLITGKKSGKRTTPYAGFSIAWCLGIIAISGPTWDRLPQTMHNNLTGRVIVFDLSRSMNSTDIKPDRLTRAKFKLNDIILSGAATQQGLVVFAGDAFTVSPMTDDVDTLINLLPSLNSDTLPVQGSRSDLGINLAISLLENTGFRRGEIILIADGVSDATPALAEMARARGYTVSVMAVGTSQGEPIPLESGKYLKDNFGNIVIPSVDQDKLSDIARKGGGRFTRLTTDSSDIDILTGDVGIPSQFTSSLTKSDESDQFITERWIDRGPWFALPLLLFALLSFRKGWVFSICLIAFPLSPQNAYAFSWQDLWSRPDQQAALHFESQEWDKIPGNASPEWKAAARYRSEDYKGAIEIYENSDQSDSATHFNLGNALAKSNNLEKAIASYSKAIEINPNMESAKYNRDLVEKMLEQQQEQQSQNSDTGNENQQDEEKGEKQKSDNNSQSKKQNAGSENGETDSENEASRNRDPTSDQGKPEKSEPEKSASQNQNAGESNQAVSDEQGSGVDKQLDRSAGTMDEQQQAMEQWLRQVPDNPGGLLRRKFAQQYFHREQQETPQTW
jgi:Ca-activated chloride channel family protein